MSGRSSNSGVVVNENNTQTISAMISSLKSAFREADFDNVEAVLVLREEKLKLEIEAKGKDIAVLLQEKALAEEKYECHRLDKLRLENEVKEHCGECLAVKSLNSQLCQEVKGLNERLANYEKDKEVIIKLRQENCELKCENLRLENEVGFFRSKFEDWETRVSVLERDWASLKGVEPSGSKSDAARVFENGLREKGVSENEKGWEKSENVNAEEEVLGEKGMSVKNVESREKVDVKTEVVDLKTEVVDVSAMDWHENVLEAKDGSPACGSPENGDGCVGASGSGRPISKDVVEIGDSDDDESASCEVLGEKETTLQGPVDEVHSGEAVGLTGTRGLKRKQALCVNAGGNDNNDDVEDLPGLFHSSDISPINHFSVTAMPSGSNSGGKVLTPSRQDLVVLGGCVEKMGSDHKSQNQTSEVDVSGFNDSHSMGSASSYESSTSAELDLSFEYPIDSPECQSKREHKKWDSEAEMISALEKDGELCMRAVCALYKQQAFVEKSFSNSSTSQNQGFNKLDAIRGTTLAKFLIDGDSQGQLKKSVKDLMNYDQKGLDDCRRLAIEHSKQLFEIYQQKDPLFLN